MRQFSPTTKGVVTYQADVTPPRRHTLDRRFFAPAY